MGTTIAYPPEEDHRPSSLGGAGSAGPGPRLGAGADREGRVALEDPPGPPKGGEKRSNSPLWGVRGALEPVEHLICPPLNPQRGVKSGQIPPFGGLGGLPGLLLKPARRGLGSLWRAGAVAQRSGLEKKGRSPRLRRKEGGETSKNRSRREATTSPENARYD